MSLCVCLCVPQSVHRFSRGRRSSTGATSVVALVRSVSVSFRSVRPGASYVGVSSRGCQWHQRVDAGTVAVAGHRYPAATATNNARAAQPRVHVRAAAVRPRRHARDACEDAAWRVVAAAIACRHAVWRFRRRQRFRRQQPWRERWSCPAQCRQRQRQWQWLCRTQHRVCDAAATSVIALRTFIQLVRYSQKCTPADLERCHSRGVHHTAPAVGGGGARLRSWWGGCRSHRRCRRPRRVHAAGCRRGPSPCMRSDAARCRTH
jgi:hypothetical protein